MNAGTVRSRTFGVRMKRPLAPVSACTIELSAAGQVDRQQQQVEAIDAERVERLVAAVAQVDGHRQEVREPR